MPCALCVQVGKADRHILQQCYDEFCYMQHGLRFHLQEIDDLTCLACQDEPLYYHNDANMKLYTWRWKAGHLKEAWRLSGYDGRLFLPDEDVRRHLLAVETARHPQPTHVTEVCATLAQQYVTMWLAVWPAPLLTARCLSL